MHRSIVTKQDTAFQLHAVHPIPVSPWRGRFGRPVGVGPMARQGGGENTLPRHFFGHPDRRPDNITDNNLVIVYGASDDLMYFEGAIVEEVGVLDGRKVHVYNAGILKGSDDLDVWLDTTNKVVKAKWCENGYPWSYETEISHSTFDIVEDGKKYCRAIVFSLEDIK